MRHNAFVLMALGSLSFCLPAFADSSPPAKEAACEGGAAKKVKKAKPAPPDEAHAAQSLDIKTRGPDGTIRERTDSVKFNQDGSGETKSTTEVKGPDGSSREAVTDVKRNPDGSGTVKTESDVASANGSTVRKSKVVTQKADGTSTSKSQTVTVTR